MLSSAERNQYSRHLILNEIGEDGQKRLKNSRVLVIGAGGLGCPILQYLTAAGVGTIGIIDHDKVEQSNLQRQVLFSHEDIGQFKVEAAVKRLANLNPYVNFVPYVERLTNQNAISIFKNFDIIVDGSDNFPTRYLVNDAAVISEKPLVFGSIFKFEGQVSVFNYKSGPTYRCLFPEPPQPGEVPSCSDIGVLGVLPGIIGAFQANEVIKIICDIGEVSSGKLIVFNALNMTVRSWEVSRDKNIQVKELLDSYDSFCGIDNTIQEIKYNEFIASQRDYQLLDVRTREERNQFNLGGLHIPLNELQYRIEELESRDVVVYCQSGMRSKKAIEVLRKNGFMANTINLKGGVSGI